MHIRSYLLIAALAFSAAVAGTSPASAILGGTESPRPYSFMGSLQRPESPRADGHVCGVIVIAPQWVISASHCARTPTLAPVGTPRGWKVRVGSLDVTSGGEVAEVDKFYRLAVERDGLFGKDISLLHLRTPVHAKPVRIAARTPAENTSARILGWGTTCAEGNDPACFPGRLREAHTVVQPQSACSGAIPGEELCIGSRDGSVAAANMDSGGPALVRERHRWVLAGVVSSGTSGEPTLFTDITKHSDWITGIVTGTAVPPEVPMPSLEGLVDLGTCVGSVVRTPTAGPGDPALLLTNGHCVEGQRPAPGSALVDQPADRRVSISDSAGYDLATAHANRLVYATMTGTDIAVYRLDKTYAQLAEEGAKVFQLTATPVHAGDKVKMLASVRPRNCTVEAVVPRLREGNYQLDNSIRYAASEDCDIYPGMSGSALLAADGNTIVGIHNSTNRDGQQCTDDNPCEVGPDGTVTAVEGRSYGQQVDMIPDCLTTGSKLDLSHPRCTLGRQHHRSSRR